LGHIAERVAQGIPAAVDERRGDKVDRILAELDDEDRAIVESWLHDRHLSQEDVERKLDACGIQCSDSTIRRWRKRNAPAWGA